MRQGRASKERCLVPQIGADDGGRVEPFDRLRPSVADCAADLRKNFWPEAGRHHAYGFTASKYIS
jgi:hypothetical protein